ncbi:MAG: LuxR C-terminal-related transcriptional regulator [Oceanospirillaceae bacterium]
MSESVCCLWENPNLTNTERQLIEVLAKGRVVDFMHAWDLSKSTSHFHWANVKKKFKIQDRAEVVALHKLYLAKIAKIA